MELRIIGLLNFWVFQWFFIRLALKYEGEQEVGHCWLKRVMPLSGWWSDYNYV